MWRMNDLWVVLHAVTKALVILDDCCWRVCGGDGHDKSLGNVDNCVEMAHPDFVARNNVVGQQARGPGACQYGAAVFASSAVVDPAAELLGDKLCAVTDPERRNP